MVVPNRFSVSNDERAEALRAFSAVIALVGVGLAAGLLALPDAPMLDAVGGLLVLGAIGLGLGLAARVWLLPGWHGSHSAYALGVAACWLALAFSFAGPAGVLPLVLGASALGTGLAGLGSSDPLARPRREGA